MKSKLKLFISIIGVAFLLYISLVVISNNNDYVITRENGIYKVCYTDTEGFTDCEYFNNMTEVKTAIRAAKKYENK